MSTWAYAAAIDEARRRTLLEAPQFEFICDQVVDEMNMLCCHTELCCDDSDYKRIVFCIEISRSVFDLFFNSANGYRGAYYRSPECGLEDVTHCCWSIDDDGMVTGTRKDKLLIWDGKQVRIEDVQALADDLTNFVLHLNRATRPDQELALGALGTTYTKGAPVPDLETTATAAASEPKITPIGKPKDD